MRRKKIEHEALEPRILLSADPIAAVIAQDSQGLIQQPIEQIIDAAKNPTSAAADNKSPVIEGLEDNQLIIVDRTVKDYHQLVASLITDLTSADNNTSTDQNQSIGIDFEQLNTHAQSATTAEDLLLEGDGISVYVLGDSEQYKNDSIERISDVLASFEDLSAVHILPP